MIVKIEVMSNGYVVSVEHNIPELCRTFVFNKKSDALKCIHDAMPRSVG